MGEIQGNRLRMYYSVIATCENRSELWCENQVFVKSFVKFRSKIPQIKQCIDILMMENMVTESFKSIDRIELEEVAVYLIGKMLVYARKSNQENLENDLNNDKSNLAHCKDIELIRICNSLTKLSADNMLSLKEFGVTVGNIAELQRLTSTLSINTGRTKNSRIKTKTTDERLKKLFKECEELLKNHLDKDVEFFKNSELGFYSEYMASRVIFDDIPLMHGETLREGSIIQ